jgi:3-oxoacyl-[acyl-carrier-protein] synthase-3
MEGNTWQVLPQTLVRYFCSWYRWGEQSGGFFMTVPNVGILSAACFLPAKTKTIQEVFFEEGVEFTKQANFNIGIQNIHVFDGKDPTALALEAAQLVIQKAKMSPSEIDVIIDFSVLPQKYVEPAWSMSNEIQYRLAAKNAFTLGFSGGGSTNFHVALNFATSLLKAEDNIRTVLLVASDIAIPNNRILDRKKPVTVLSDASSSIILQKNAPNGVVLDICLRSDGSLDDISYIRGGGIAYPDRLDQYKMSFDHEKFATIDEMTILRQLVARVLKKHSLRPEDIKYYLYPNFSHMDQGNYIMAFDKGHEVCAANCSHHGHVQATDFVLNYQGMQDAGIKKGEYVLVVSHGNGFLAGVALIRY